MAPGTDAVLRSINLALEEKEREADRHQARQTEAIREAEGIVENQRARLRTAEEHLAALRQNAIPPTLLAELDQLRAAKALFNGNGAAEPDPPPADETPAQPLIEPVGERAPSHEGAENEGERVRRKMAKPMKPAERIVQARDIVLDAEGPFTRAWLAEQMGTELTVASTALKALIDQGIVTDKDEDGAVMKSAVGRGRPSNLYRHVEKNGPGAGALLDQQRKASQPSPQETAVRDAQRLGVTGEHNASGSRPKCLDKDLDKMVDKAYKAGWRIERGGNDHLKCYPPNGKGEAARGTRVTAHVSVPNTPSKQRTTRRIRSAFRRAGLNV